jgi:hypothetical protein
MKLAIVFLVIIWLLCGLVGAWWLDDLDSQHWKTILEGPITLARAYNDYQPTYPGGS